jgi:hypothetical protein
LQQLYQAALANLIEAQKSDELNGILLKLENAHKLVNMKIPAMFIIGDIQGGDTITRQPACFNKFALRISQTCDAGPNQLTAPLVGSCKRIIMSDVMKFVTDQNQEALAALYQAQHWIAWFDLDYGGNLEGIFSAACPPEDLHALENGLFCMFWKSFLRKYLKVLYVSFLTDRYIHGIHIMDNIIFNHIQLMAFQGYCILVVSPNYLI